MPIDYWKECKAEIARPRAENERLMAALIKLQTYLRNGKWDGSEGVANFIDKALAPAPSREE
jgi:hypothetical protein